MLRSGLSESFELWILEPQSENFLNAPRTCALVPIIVPCESIHFMSFMSIHQYTSPFRQMTLVGIFWSYTGKFLKPKSWDASMSFHQWKMPGELIGRSHRLCSATGASNGKWMLMVCCDIHVMINHSTLWMNTFHVSFTFILEIDIKNAITICVIIVLLLSTEAERHIFSTSALLSIELLWLNF